MKLKVNFGGIWACGKLGKEYPLGKTEKKKPSGFITRNKHGSPACKTNMPYLCTISLTPRIPILFSWRGVALEFKHCLYRNTTEYLVEFYNMHIFLLKIPTETYFYFESSLPLSLTPSLFVLVCSGAHLLIFRAYSWPCSKVAPGHTRGTMSARDWTWTSCMQSIYSSLLGYFFTF